MYKRLIRLVDLLDLAMLESPARRGSLTTQDEPLEEDEGTVFISCMYKLKLPFVASTSDKQGSQQSSRVLQPTQSSAMHSHKTSGHVYTAKGHNSSKSIDGVSTVTFCPSKRRLYVGTESGELSFWVLGSEGSGASSRKLITTQLGLVSSICVPQANDGSLLGKAGLMLSGSASGNIGIWDYQGRVAHEPTVSCQTLYSNGGTVTGLECYGAHILSISTDGTLKIWKSVEGRANLKYPWFEQQQILMATDGWLRSLVFGRDEGDDISGTFFVSSDGGSVMKVLPSCVVHDDGQKLIKNQVFSTSSFLGASLDDFSRPAQDRGIISLKYVPSWKVLFTISYDHRIRGYDVVVGALKWEWENEGRCPFAALEVDLEYDEVVAVDSQGLMSIFSIKTGSLFATKNLFPGPSIQKVVSILKVKRQQFAVTRETDVTLWEINHSLDYNILRGGHEKAVVSLYACSGGVGATEGERDFRIFSASVDNTVRLWDWFDMACVRIFEHVPSTKSQSITPSSSEISSMTFYEAWRILVTGELTLTSPLFIKLINKRPLFHIIGHENGDLRLWDLDTGKARLMDGPQHSNSISCLTMAIMRRNEELLLTAGFDGWVVVWDIRHVRGEPPHMITKFKAHGPGSPFLPGEGTPEKPSNALGQSAIDLISVSPPEVLCILYDAAKKVIFTGGNEGIIKVWSIVGYSLRGLHRGHTGPVTCLALDSNFLFSGSDDCQIRVWDAVPALESHNKPSQNRPSSPGQDRVPSFTPPSTAPTFFTNDKSLSVLSGHTSSVSAIQVLWGWGCGGQVLSCSLDGTLRLWDYVLGQQVHKYVAPGSEELRCIAVRSDKPEILVGASNGNILRFPLPVASSEVPNADEANLVFNEAEFAVEEEEEDNPSDPTNTWDDQDDEQLQPDVNPDEYNDHEASAREVHDSGIIKPRSKESIGLQLVKLTLPSAAMKARGMKGSLPLGRI